MTLYTAYEKDAPMVEMFLAGFLEKGKYTNLSLMAECEGFRFDCDAAELQNCFVELRREGFTQSMKRVFVGDHFYRSDTAKCPRCYRFRPEVYYDLKKEFENCVCDRCRDALEVVP